VKVWLRLRAYVDHGGYVGVLGKAGIEGGQALAARRCIEASKRLLQHVVERWNVVVQRYSERFGSI
jgi:hypothetical protein